MDCLDLLADEHRWIARLSDALERLAARTVERGQLDPHRAGEILTLFERFADGSHQRKEEEALFPRLRERVEAGRAGALEKLCADHEEERRRMESMHVQLLGAIVGEPGCVTEFVRHARSYVDLHRKHMAHERIVLFPMAERLLRPEDDPAIRADFARIDDEESFQAPELVARIDELARSLGVLGKAG